MIFSINKEEIVGELQILQGIVEKKNTMPILANILLKVKKDEVEMVGTDLEVGMITHFPARIEDEGALTVSGKKIFEIVRSIPDGQLITFKEIEGLRMEITSGASEFKILCLPHEDYPQIPEPRFEKGISLPLEEVKEMIDRVYYAITQEQRYYLNGALMIIKDKSIELVSTDGHRLSYTKKELEGLKIGGELRGIVSKKTLGEIKKLDGEDIEFDLDENNLFFRVKNKTLISRMIEGKFPNYEAVMPRDNPNRLSFSRDEMASSIKRVSLLSSERSKGIKLFLSKKQVDLFSSSPEMGEAHDRIQVDYEGKEMEIGFNSQYLLDFLNTVKNERVVVEIKDENSAVMMKPEVDDEIQYLYVLMPMKI